MGDFLLDFRDPETRRRSAARAASLLQFTADARVQTLECDSFSLVLARVDGFGLWGPCEWRSGNTTVLIALAGRVALEEHEWEEAEKGEGAGGLACKAILGMYRREGLGGLGRLNGNFVIFVHDERKNEFYLVTDKCGMFLAYRRAAPGNSQVFGSHPDVLADVSGESQKWDTVSLSEFLMTSRLSFPHTYYRNIRALEPGCVFSFRLRDGRVAEESQTRYFRFDFRPDARATEQELAEELAGAFKQAVRKRTLPRFGGTGIGLSGGLDSRTVLSAVDPRCHRRAFTLFDEENAELEVAKAIADACRVELLPLKRDFEYYGNSAELGVRVSGGTGCISCNHFLGVWERLKEAGVTNVLTGCYCDYLFKGLAFNRAEKWLSRNHRLASFQFEFYDPFHWLQPPYREKVLARLEERFPEAGKARLSEEDWAAVERKRTFPLAYEQDLAQRVIPQRIMPWYVPIVDNDIIEAYSKIPPRFKVSGSLFGKMLPLVCSPSVCRIPNSNTGCRADAAWPKHAWARCYSALKNRLAEKLAPSVATRGSWPNWHHYLSHSQAIKDLWNRPNQAAKDVFTEILKTNPFTASVSNHANGGVVLFQRLFTQKLWLDQRVS